MITPSRRTPAEVVGFLREADGRQPHLFWDGRARTPIRSSWRRPSVASCRPDSVNMTASPARRASRSTVFEPEGGSAKFARFHAALRRHGATRPLPARFERLEAGPIRRSIQGCCDRRGDRAPLEQTAADAGWGRQLGLEAQPPHFQWFGERPAIVYLGGELSR
jgi:hypothetical protein